MPPRPNSEVDERGASFDYTMPLDEALARYARATDNVMSRLLDRDEILPPETRARNPDQSYFDGHLPPGWSSLPARELGNLFELMTMHADFIGTKLTYAKAEKANADERLKLVRAHIRRSKRGTNDANDGRLDQAYRFGVVVELDELDAVEIISRHCLLPPLLLRSP